MAQATVKTVQYVDPRIEPQPDPVYEYVIGPTQNQYYKIPASGLSDDNITFNNLTTLGVDRAYLDTFEIELETTITFNLEASGSSAGAMTGGTVDTASLFPKPDSWTFQSFPFNTCCDEARVNINGGAFFSQPMSYIRAKERYMNQHALSRCYENVCPIHRPLLQTESGKNYNEAMDRETARALNLPVFSQLNVGTTLQSLSLTVDSGKGVPTRYGRGIANYMQSEEGMCGGFNNSIVRLGKLKRNGSNQIIGYENSYYDTIDGKPVYIIKVKWREPLFVSPFSSRYDATYGRPLYNITSMDFAFNMMNLGNMIRIANYHTTIEAANSTYISNYNVHIDAARLCYQVMTIPAILQKPLTTLVPYRRFVPYITEYKQQSGSAEQISIDGAENIEILSGVYTMNEIPTAIWIFCAPTKDTYQQNRPDVYDSSAASAYPGDNVNAVGNWDSNKLFAYLRKVNISLANTTQILNTAEPVDLYRIAKANGCEDSYWSWQLNDAMDPKYVTAEATEEYREIPAHQYYGAGSVLRLKPGVDIIVPDIPLIPGANANNMVFQVRANFDIPPHSANQSKYALWLLFEYVGVAAISPGQCEITMNPLGSGEIMAVSPVISATSEATEGQLEGSGFWDRIKKGTRIAGQLADDGIISRILRRIPGAEKAAKWAEAHGLGEPGCKRARGGAVIGHGLNEWV